MAEIRFLLGALFGALLVLVVQALLRRERRIVTRDIRRDFREMRRE